jgi:hypothetical protein
VVTARPSETLKCIDVVGRVHSSPFNLQLAVSRLRREGAQR